MRVLGWLLGAWGILTGALILFTPYVRFTAAQWEFIQTVPGQQDTFGVLFLILSLWLIIGTILRHDRHAKYASYAIGSTCVTLAVAITLPIVTNPIGSIIGLPAFGFIGVCFLIFANLVGRPRYEKSD